jgi:hypothetical protein
MRGAAAALVLAGCVTCTGAAWAQEQPAEVDPQVEARQQYQMGREAFAAKRFVEAAMHFEAAAAQRPHAVALYTAALAWEQAGRPERAADAYARALEVPGLNADQAGKARDRVAQLERTLGTLAVMAPEGWRLQLDNFTEVTGHARLHAPPGVHTLTVRPPGKAIHKREVTFEAGQTVRLEIAEDTEASAAVAKREPPKEEPKPELHADGSKAGRDAGSAPEASGSLRRTLGFVALGAGGLGLVSGIVLGTQAVSAGDAYDAAPSRAGLDHAESLATWTTVTFIASGVFLAGGVTLLLLPESAASARVSVSPTGATLRGAF